MEHERSEDKLSEETLLGDADEVDHPSIEEQLDERLEEEQAQEEGDSDPG
jgi:hypothetical protein